jgi:hypothetical protein
MSLSAEEERRVYEEKARSRLWMFWAPVAVAPIPYVCVSLYKSAKTPQAKSLLLGVGMIGVPVMTYAARVFLMSTTTGETTTAGPSGMSTTTLQDQNQLNPRF